MTDNVDVASATSFIPKAWTQIALDAIKGDSITLSHPRSGTEVQWHENWTSVYTPDGERFSSTDNVKIELLEGLVCEFRGSKVVTRYVPDEAAQSDLQALLDKWTAEGKDDIATTVLMHGCYECSDGGSILEDLTYEVTETVERVAPASECKFYMAPPLNWRKHAYTTYDVVANDSP